MKVILSEEGFEFTEIDFSIVIAIDKPKVRDEFFPISLAELGKQCDAIEKSDEVVASLNEDGNYLEI